MSVPAPEIPNARALDDPQMAQISAEVTAESRNVRQSV
jgi:hypothetical protein